jgi:hypothetical protein
MINSSLVMKLNDTNEANCLTNAFQQTHFLEYNIIATSAVQMDEDKEAKLDRILAITKNIFIYAAINCLITEDTLMELFRDFSHKINVNDDEFWCVLKETMDRDLIDKVHIDNIAQYWDEKFAKNSTLHFTNNKVDIKNSAHHAQMNARTEEQEATTQIAVNEIKVELNYVQNKETTQISHGKLKINLFWTFNNFFFYRKS